MYKLKKCKCGREPIFYRVGDYKKYWVVGCHFCGNREAKYHEARVTKYFAAKLWNRRIDQ